MKQVVIVKFHELALKGKNRAWFIGQLKQNVQRAVSDTGVEDVWIGQMMIGLTLSARADWPTIRERVRNCPGIAKLFLADMVPKSLDDVKRLLADKLAGRAFESFRISARRADKRFPMTSDQINRELGSFVEQLTGSKVNLRHPEQTIWVDVLPREILVYFEEVQAYGGLPVGVSGKVMALLSGGIDSPVAAWMMMKRGCQVTFTHFHSHPMSDTSSIEKATELAEILAKFQGKSTLILAPFIETQKRLIVSTPSPYRVVLYRRFMVRVAEELARRYHAKALVTGESVGQVSSQTLENISTIDDAATLPILRPLVGANKQEIITVAREIGSYPISILPDQDCCTLFTPRHPHTHTQVSVVRELEKTLPVEAMVKEVLDRVEVREFHYPSTVRPTTVGTPQLT